jgi:hypothetical protein
VGDGEVECPCGARAARLRGRRHRLRRLDVWSDVEDGQVWHEERIGELLDRERTRTLFVSGTVSNQGRFYPRFDAVVLLSAPAEVLLGRVASRETNDYGKRGEERELILHHLAEVEPLLRATCTHEIDATQPLELVVRSAGRDRRERHEIGRRR